MTPRQEVRAIINRTAGNMAELESAILVALAGAEARGRAQTQAPLLPIDRPAGDWRELERDALTDPVLHMLVALDRQGRDPGRRRELVVDDAYRLELLVSVVRWLAASRREAIAREVERLARIRPSWPATCRNAATMVRNQARAIDNEESGVRALTAAELHTIADILEDAAE